MTASYHRKVVVPIEYLVATRESVPGNTGCTQASPAQKLQTLTVMVVACLSSSLCRTTVVHHQSTTEDGCRSPLQDYSSVCHQNNYPRKSSNNVPVFQVFNGKFLSLSATALIGLSLTGVVPRLRHSEGRISMLAAEANNYFFQRPKRAVAIRRDGDDFVVSLMPNDVVIFRNESADALRKLCKGLRWAVVSDTAIACI
jgi:hypothetical protein